MIQELDIAGYRSIRRLTLSPSQVVLISGANGCGKTNLYRALYLLHAAAAGTLARTLADEGGMPSALWAGSRKHNDPVRMSIEVTIDDLRYSLALGLPSPDGRKPPPDGGPNIGPGGEPSLFVLDPQVKAEHIRLDGKRGVELMSRGGAGSAWMRDADGNRVVFAFQLSQAESVLAQISEPHLFPVASRLRQEMLSWRFYHHFRTDERSPLRQPQTGVLTPILSHDGRDLAAALQTILEIGDGERLRDHLRRAFPGSELEVDGKDARFSIRMTMPGLGRSLESTELSDGTLRYLCLCAALLGPRPPTLLALNEPETSLHPDLLEPLAELLSEAARSSQLWVTTHSERLTKSLARLTGTKPVQLTKASGETQIVSDEE